MPAKKLCLNLYINSINKLKKYIKHFNEKFQSINKKLMINYHYIYINSTNYTLLLKCFIIKPLIS